MASEDSELLGGWSTIAVQNKVQWSNNASERSEDIASMPVTVSLIGLGVILEVLVASAIVVCIAERKRKLRELSATRKEDEQLGGETGSRPMSLPLLHVSDERKVCLLEAHNGGLALSPAAYTDNLAKDGSIRRHPQQMTVLKTDSQVTGVAHLLDKIFVVCRSSRSILVFASKQPFNQLPGIDVDFKHDPTDIAAWPEVGSLFVAERVGRCIWRVAARPGTATTATVFSDNISPCSLSPGGRWLAVVTEDRRLRVFGADGDEALRVELAVDVDPLRTFVSPVGPGAMVARSVAGWTATVGVMLQPAQQNGGRNGATEVREHAFENCVHASLDDDGRWVYYDADQRCAYRLTTDMKERHVLLRLGDFTAGCGRDESVKLRHVSDRGLLMLCYANHVEIYDVGTYRA